jgi:rhodanese-related sulfurtransferase
MTSSRHRSFLRRTLPTVIAASALSGLAGCGQDADETATGATATTRQAPAFLTVQPTRELAARIDRGDVLLVDVREPDEYEAGHAPKSVPVPLGQVQQKIADLERQAAGRPIAFICRSGNRSAQAAKIAADAGVTSVTNVDGGMGAWVQAGLRLLPADGRVL